MERNGIIESLVGLIVLVAAGVFLFYSWSVSGQSLARDTYTLNAVFGRIDGIAAGADVRIAGVKVGTVSGFALKTDTYEATVSLAISRSTPVPEDSIAKIVSDGLLGGAHVALEPGASDVFLVDGESVTITQGSVDLLGLAVQAFTSGGAKNDASPSDKPAQAPSGGLSLDP
ncbi:MAG: outer membrane lipid asymmetry maintenance protein MlaD [Pseudomonadota bacterium]